MIAILTIGHARFALESATKASKIMELLSDAMPIREHYLSGGYQYSPDLERHGLIGVEMKIVDERSLLSSAPKDGEPLPPPISVGKARQHPGPPKRLLIGGGK